MKKHVLLLTIAAFALTGLWSCSNGDYDADPTTNLTGSPNLGDPNGGGGTGYVRFKMGGQDMNFSPATFYDTTNMFTNEPQRSVGATAGPATSPTGTCSINIDNFNGVGDYTIVTTGGTSASTFAVTEFGPGNTPKNLYLADGDGIVLKVTFDNGQRMKGTFQGELKQLVGGNETKSVTDGVFDVPKQP